MNSGNKDTATQRVVIATDDIPTGLTNTILNAVNGSIGTGNTALGAIKTAVELLDNVVDGDYLNVNANIGGADFAVNSGNKDSATQRVVIATDDVPFTTLNTHLSEIEDAVETLQACVDSNKVKVQFEAGDLNIGNVDVVSSVLPSGASTESTLGSMSAKLPATLGQKANANCISTCRSSTAGAYDMSGRTTIATAGTSTKLLCDAQGHLQVDVISGGGSTDVSGVATHAKQDIIIGHVDGIEGLIGTTNSGLSSIDSGITDIDGLIVEGNALLTTIDSDTSAIKTAIQLLDNALDGNYFNVNANIAGTDVSSNSGNKDAQTQRVVIATDDIPIALVNSNLVEIESTADAILAKNTELETLLTSISQRTATGTLSTATNLVDGGALAIVDTAGYRYMTIFGKATNDVDLYIQYSLTNSAGAMISLYNETPYKLQSVSAINGIITFNTTIEHMARYVRFINFSGNQINALTLYYQLSN